MDIRVIRITIPQNQQPLISVIVPIYNLAAYLPRCLDGLICQTHTNLQIVLVNDGSTDGVETLCELYARQDTRIQVIHQKNTGVSAARNAGIDVSKGDWLGFVDADDYVSTDMYEKLLRAAVESRKQIAVCGYVKYHFNGVIERQPNSQIPPVITEMEALNYVLQKGYFEGFMVNKLFAHKLFENGSPKRLNTGLHFCEDLLFFSEIVLCTDGLAYVPETLYHYFLRENGAMYTFDEKRETELTARKWLLEIVTPISTKFISYVKGGYTEASVNMLCMARKKKKKYRPGIVQFLRKESLRYGKDYIFSRDVSALNKLRALAIFLFPKISYGIWLRTKNFLTQLNYFKIK
jgi:glycosyltransferase involved in cell wall biosynthesis